MAVDHGWHKHAHTLAPIQTEACVHVRLHKRYTHYFICTRFRHTHTRTQTRTQTRTFSHACARAIQRCPLITAKKGSPGGSLGRVCFTSLHPPLCNNQVLKYHQTNRGRGTCVAFLGRRRATETPAPSFLSSSYASPPPDLLGTERRKRRRERGSEKEEMKRWEKDERPEKSVK